MTEISSTVFIIIILIALWTLPWKGYAMWVSAQRKEKWWFIAFLLLNTVAILEIIYLFFFVKRIFRKEKESIKSVESDPPRAI